MWGKAWLGTLLLAAALVCVSMQETPRKKYDPPEDVFDLKLLELGWSNWSKYEAGQKIGRGKYSEVTECVERSSGEKRVCKVFKSYDQFKILKEAKILQQLQGGPNMIGFYDAVRGIYEPVVEDYDKDDEKWGFINRANTSRYGLIFEHVSSRSYKTQFAEFEDNDVRWYLHEVLWGLAFIHSKGIMHRDLKPHNIVYNHTDRKVRIIDFGLSDWYSPDRHYSLSVGSRYYKAPELLVGSHKYDYSVDVWAAGCVMGAMIYQFTPLFEGEEDKSQLTEIVEVLGTEGFLNWTAKSGIEWNQTHVDLETITEGSGFQKRLWSEFVDEDNEHLAHNQALDLLDRLLRYDSRDRLTAREALKHPYFDPIRNLVPSRTDLADPLERYVQPGYQERIERLKHQARASVNNVDANPRTMERYLALQKKKKEEEERAAAEKAARKKDADDEEPPLPEQKSEL